MPGTFRCTLVTPESQVLDEEVTHVTVPAWDGQIGFLPGRAPLLAKLGYGIMRMDLAQGGRRFFYIGEGFAQMKGNQLTVLTEEAQPPESIDPAEAEAALKEAQARVAGNEQEAMARDRARARARALVAAARHAH